MLLKQEGRSEGFLQGIELCHWKILLTPPGQNFISQFYFKFDHFKSNLVIFGLENPIVGGIAHVAVDFQPS